MTSAMAVVYATKSNMELKAAAEIQNNGVHSEVPFDDSGSRRKVTAPGYVFAGREVVLPFAKHVKRKIGYANPGDIVHLYVLKLERRADEVIPFSIGQSVRHGEIPAKVIDVRGRFCRIETYLLGKTHTQTIHYTKLRPG